jgi:hypothetical protein
MTEKGLGDIIKMDHTEIGFEDVRAMDLAHDR